jgi:hypothetical protein
MRKGNVLQEAVFRCEEASNSAELQIPAHMYINKPAKGFPKLGRSEAKISAMLC